MQVNIDMKDHIFELRITACDVRAGRDGKVGCNTLKYTMVLLYSNCLYILWHVTELFIQGNSEANGHLPF